MDGREALSVESDSTRIEMRVPVPKNRLVVLTLFGILVTGLLSVALADPGILPSQRSGTDGGTDQTVAADAPAPNDSFTPAVQTQSGGGYEDGEEEEHEEEERDEEEEYEEHEEEDD